MATVANEAFHELLMNWISFAKEHELPLVVGALDDSILQRCKDSGVPAVSLQHAGFETSLISLSEHAVKHKDFRSSQKGFQNYGVRKLAFLLTLLEMGYDVSLSDTDVVWTKRCGILEPKIIQTGDKRAVSSPVFTNAFIIDIKFIPSASGRSPAELFAREGEGYSHVADVLVTSDCLSQDIDERMV
jgi:hypothetical protein